MDFTICLSEQIKELDREIAARERIFPIWINSGQIKRDTAEWRLAALRAARDTLGDLAAGSSADAVQPHRVEGIRTS